MKARHADGQTSGSGRPDGVGRVCPSATDRPRLTRRGFIGGLTAASALFAPSLSIGRAEAGIRRLRMTNHRSEEMIDMVFWIDGQYIKPALAALDYFMRDLREEKMIRMDRRNIDNLAATQKLLETSEPFNLVSGYRTKRTNELLATQTYGVARNSLHIQGMAADIRMRNRSVRQIADAARRCESGGVGQYARSNFVHVDCGRPRSW